MLCPVVGRFLIRQIPFRSSSKKYPLSIRSPLETRVYIRYQPKNWWQCRCANNCPLNWAKIICAIINNSRALFDPIFNADIRPLYVCTKNNYLLLITRRCWLKLVKNLKKINPFKISSSIMEFFFLLFSDESGRRTIFFKYTKPSNLTLNIVFNDQLNTNWTYASFA